AVASAVYPGIGVLTALFVGVTLSITALPIMAVMVSEFGLIGRPFGSVVMAAALINELAAVTVFAVLLQFKDAGNAASWVSLGTALGSTALFVGVVFGAYQFLKYLQNRRLRINVRAPWVLSLRSREAGFAVLMILSLGAALFSQYLGLTFVIGAFYAGILVTPESAGREAYANARSVLLVVMWGFFIPLFFAITGLQVNLHLLVGLTAAIAFVTLLLVAMFAKIGIGAGFAKLVGWKNPDAFALGFLVNSRGAVEIAMAVILLADGDLSTFWFTVVVAAGLVCTVVAPIGAVASWKSTPESRSELYNRVPALRVHPAMLTPGAPLTLRPASEADAEGGLRVSFSPPPGSAEPARTIPLPSSIDTEAAPVGPPTTEGTPSGTRPRRPPGEAP
ncbi:MAG: cation:proton antiporter, partial [Thermoplasmata archaeon]|nr:cation:proton antiporter [Thermoplasmata archaeon]